VQKFLDLIRQLMRLKDPQIRKPSGPWRQHRLGKLGRQRRLIKPVELKRKEQEVRSDICHALAHRLVEASDGRVRAVAAEEQLGIGHDSAKRFLDRLVTLQRLGQTGGRLRSELPGIALPESRGALLRRLQVLHQDGAVHPVIEISEVPVRQEFGAARRRPGRRPVRQARRFNSNHGGISLGDLALA
jgi:hypothetical protein